MKLKTEFITNSSSASFTIPLIHLTPLQIGKIQNHIEESKTMVYRRGPEVTLYNTRSDQWEIDVLEDEIRGETTMDNFDMLWFLKQIGVDEKHVRYDNY